MERETEDEGIETRLVDQKVIAENQGEGTEAEKQIAPREGDPRYFQPPFWEHQEE